MPIFEESLFSYLTGVTAVNALIDTRFYPAGLLPETPETPATTYQLVAEQREVPHNGGALPLVRSVYQFNHYAQTYLEAKELAKEARLALHGFKGVMAGHRVDEARLSRNIEDFSESYILQRVIQDYAIWHTEEVSP